MGTFTAANKYWQFRCHTLLILSVPFCFKFSKSSHFVILNVSAKPHRLLSSVYICNDVYMHLPKLYVTGNLCILLVVSLCLPLLRELFVLLIEVYFVTMYLRQKTFFLARDLQIGHQESAVLSFVVVLAFAYVSSPLKLKCKNGCFCIMWINKNAYVACIYVPIRSCIRAYVLIQLRRLRISKSPKLGDCHFPSKTFLQIEANRRIKNFLAKFFTKGERGVGNFAMSLTSAMNSMVCSSIQGIKRLRCVREAGTTCASIFRSVRSADCRNPKKNSHKMPKQKKKNSEAPIDAFSHCHDYITSSKEKIIFRRNTITN